MSGGTHRRLWLWIIAAVAVVAAGMLVLAAFQILQADRVGARGKSALLRAEDHLSAHDVSAARQDLLEAQRDFRTMQHHLSRMGPFAPVARITPFVRIQVRGANEFARAGVQLSDAGLNLVNAADRVIHPADKRLRIADAVVELEHIRSSLDDGLTALDQAADRVRALDGLRLIGPLDGARHDLARRLPEIGARAVSARDGLDALIDMLGGNGPRRFLVVSQNPDEVRPTGGFIGTYGLLTTRDGHLELTQYDAISKWYARHPQAQVPASQAALPLQLASPPYAQTLANVNATADFPAAARLAAALWRAGGEAPIDGVISMTPAVMARVLRVLGPVTVPTYNETVTADNLQERVDFHTHLEANADRQPGGRKGFLVELVHVVVQRLLDAPASKWDPLGQAIARGFEAREAMAWSNRPVIETALNERSWTGALPVTGGDFLYDAEFEYSAKNGRGLHRVFDHTVVLHNDGSAQITTKVTIANTQPASTTGLVNIDSLSFVTLYGPYGAVLNTASDPPDAEPPPLAGHPAASWFAAAAPESSTSFTVVWNVPHLLTTAANGTRVYTLRVLRLPAHDGDVVRLHVKPPPGWRWEQGAPAPSFVLDQDLNKSWPLLPA